MTASPHVASTRRPWTVSGRCSALTIPYTLRSATSLAHDLRAAGAFRESVDLLRDTWEKYREVLGDDMLDTLRTAASLAVSLRKAGEQAEAMNLAQDTYERYKRRYGSDAPDAQSCALNLACDYAAVDDMPRALDLVTGVKAALPGAAWATTTRTPSSPSTTWRATCGASGGCRRRSR